MMNGINLSLVSHYINCDNCQNRQHCDIARMLITSVSSEGLASSTDLAPQAQSNERMYRSDPELLRRERSLLSERSEVGGATVFDAATELDKSS
jgi:hypothetical protein